MNSKERPRGGIKGLGEIIPQYFAKRGLNKAIQEGEVRKAWQEVIAPSLWEHVLVKSLQGTTLFLEVDSAALLQELKNFHGEKCREKMNELLGAERIVTIKYEYLEHK